MLITSEEEDAYALVGTIYELTSLKPPFFGHMDDDDLIEPLPDRVPPKIASRIMACISYQPERHPDAFDLLRSIKWHKAGLVPSPTPTPKPTPSASGTSSAPPGIFEESRSSARTGSRDPTLASAVGADIPIRGYLPSSRGSTQNKTSGGFLLRYMHIPVKKSTGGTIDLYMEHPRLVYEIMEEIQEVEGTPLARQRLIFQYKQLEPERTIASYNIQSGSPLHLVLRSHDPSGTRDVTSPDIYPIFVEELGWGVHQYPVSRSWTVADLQTKIEQSLGFPAAHQRIIYAGQDLEVSSMLSDCGIRRHATVRLVSTSGGPFRLKGQVQIGDRSTK
jgi:hypothetical protein